ncbi:MAG: tail fiber domain-containing protein [Bacteroidia bacterium]|nr:tail fiber domain-containing protein [Bacteroidia bacterium]
MTGQGWSGTSDNYGVVGTAAGGTNAYGLYGDASYGSTSYGVYAKAWFGSTNYGIYAAASNGSINWAGYFSGDVHVNGTFTSSDRKLKNDIRPLSGALGIIQQLKPSVYTFKTNEYKQMNLPEGLQYGLIADEVQKVIPGAVKTAVQPEEYENNESQKEKNQR